MATAKTKTTPSASESEAIQALAAAKVSREAFAAAQALTADRQSAQDNAELHEAEIEGQYSQGIDSITASEYAIAQAEVSRTDLLHAAAQRAETAAQGAVINIDVALAEITKPFVQQALKGVEVRTSFYVPKTPPSTAVAYVIQTVASEDRGGGSIAGKVRVMYYRPSLYAALVPDDIAIAADRAHCRVVAASSGTHEYGDGMKVDTVGVKIERGQSPVPLIPTPPTDTIASSNVSHAFAADLAAACKAPTDGPVRGIDREYVGAAVVVKPISGKITSMEVDDAGVRMTTVKLDLNYRREGDTRRTLHMDQHLKELLADWEGSFVPTFGTVASVKGSTGFADPLGVTAVNAEIVFRSRVR